MFAAFEYLKTKRLEQQLAAEACQIVDEDFLTWCQRVSPQYDFTYEWIKYVEAEQSKYDIILFSIPPQHGKSTVFTIHKAAYRLIKYPLQRGIIISYNSDITSRFHREILQILEKENLSLYSKSQKEIVHSNLTGSISFCGFSGGITSKPADWIIIDDPIKSADDAYSENYQDVLKSGFATSIIPRLQEKFKLEVTQTRWHEKDLIGQIMTMNEELGAGLKLKYINLPAICDSDHDPLGRGIGQVLCPERFTLETIKTKMLLAEADGYALYQGRPAPPEGALFKSEDIENETFTEIDDVPKGAISFLSVDCAFKETRNSDYVAIGIFKYDTRSQKLFLVDMINERMSFTKTVDAIRGCFLKYKCQFALVEAKANGDAVIDTLSQEFPRFVPVEPEGGKIARAFAAQPFLKTKRLKIYKHMSNFSAFINQCKSFPKGANDDMVDVLTQAINHIKKEYSVSDFTQQTKDLQSLYGVRF